MSPDSHNEISGSTSATALEAEAAEWFGKRQFWTWNDEDQVQFDKWLSESLAHQVAYWRLAAAWQRTERLNAIGLQRPLRVPTADKKDGGRILRFVAASAAILVLGVIAVTSISKLDKPKQIYTTGIGESRAVVLTDGSRIELNTNSSLSVDLSEGKRRVALERGEAFFQIHHDPSHPFTVIASGHRITDLGTKFLVRAAGRELQVTLFEGEARLDAEGNNAARSATLRPGDVAVATATSLNVSKRSPQAITNSLAWRSGLVIFGKHTTLAEAVAEFNRYNRLKLVIDDPSIAQTPIAGRFTTDGVDRFADVVTHVFGFHARKQNDAIVITR